MRSRPSMWLAALTILAITTVPTIADAQAPTKGGILRVSYGNEIANLDFHTAPGYEMMWVAMNVGCGLVNITPDGKFVGDAAESWTSTPDGLTWTFKLRKNVLFHDGTPVDAAAVKFSIDRLMDPNTKSGMRAFYEPVHSVEVMDPQTVQLRLKQPYAFLLTCWRRIARAGPLLAGATQKFTVEDRKQGKPGSIIGCAPSSSSSGSRAATWPWTASTSISCPGFPPRPRDDPRDQGSVAEMAAFKNGEVDSSPRSRPITSTR